MSPVGQRRVGLAFGLTPFVCAVLGFGLFPLLARTHAGRTVDVFESAIGFGVLTGIIGAMITGAVAHPTFERLMKRRHVTAARTILFGALFGNIPSVMAIIGTVLVRRDIGMLPEAVSGSWRAIAFGTVVGALSSAVFWSVAGPQIASTQSRGTVNKS
jgi:hypothetical protein